MQTCIVRLSWHMFALIFVFVCIAEFVAGFMKLSVWLLDYYMHLLMLSFLSGREVGWSKGLGVIKFRSKMERLRHQQEHSTSEYEHAICRNLKVSGRRHVHRGEGGEEKDPRYEIRLCIMARGGRLQRVKLCNGPTLRQVQPLQRMQVLQRVQASAFKI